MIKLVIRYSLLFFISSFVSSAAAASEYYGENFKLAEARSIEEVMLNKENNLKKTMLVKGILTKVCQSKGCWFEIKNSDNEPVRVTFKNYGYTVPKDSSGSQAIIKGQLVQKKVSAAAQRHFLKDAKASKEDIEKVKGPKMKYQFVAEGVYL